MECNEIDDFYNEGYSSSNHKSYDDLAENKKKESKIPSFPKIHFAKELTELNHLEKEKTKKNLNPTAASHSK